MTNDRRMCDVHNGKTQSNVQNMTCVGSWLTIFLYEAELSVIYYILTDLHVRIDEGSFAKLRDTAYVTFVTTKINK